MADYSVETVQVVHPDGFVYTINKCDLTEDHQLHAETPESSESAPRRPYNRKAKD